MPKSKDIFRPGTPMNGIFTIRFPLESSTCSVPLPTLVEYGRSPVLFIGVIAGGILSWAVRGRLRDKDRQAKTIPKRMELLEAGSMLWLKGRSFTVCGVAVSCQDGFCHSFVI